MMRKSLTPMVATALAAPMIAALLAHACVGLFSRYWYDDFITSAMLRDKGFVGAQRFWYSNWTGCFSHSIATSLAELVGPSLVPVLPFAALVIWVVATAWAIRPVVELLPEASQHRRSFCLVSALLLVFATANTVPDVVQSFYWQTGILKYLISLILFTICAGIIGGSVQRGDDRIQCSRVALCALLVLVTGGFSEVSAFVQVCGLALLLVASLTFARKSFARGPRALILASFCAALVALLIMAAAPGNKVRQATVTPSAGWLLSIQSSFRYALYFFEQHTRRHRGTTLLSLALPAWLVLLGLYARNKQPGFANNDPLYRPARILKLFFVVTAIGFGLIVLCFVPGFYAISEPLPGRAQILPKLLLVCLFVYWGGLGGFVLKRASVSVQRGSLLVGAVALVMLLVLSPVAAAWRTFALVPRARAYAAQWDETERQIRAAAKAGVKNVTVRSVGGNETDLGFGRDDLRLRADPMQPQNWAAALYYGVDSIRAE